MKKIILIIILILAIFQMVVLATVIIIGPGATDMGSSSATKTLVVRDNPANASGTITTVEIWAYETLSGCEVATFYVVSGNILSTRDDETVDNGNGAGVVIAGSKQTFVVDLDVEEGDYIGLYFSAGKIERASSGYAGHWYITEDAIPADEVTMSLVSDYGISIYGIGSTEEGGEANAISFGTNF